MFSQTPYGPYRVLVADSDGYAPFELLAHSGVAVTVTPNDTTEVVLATIAIPGGLIGSNGLIRVISQWSWTSSVNSKTPRIRLGGAAGTIFRNPVFTTTVGFKDLLEIFNVNNQAVQVGGFAASTSGGFGTSTASAATTGAINTAVDTTLVISGQKATGSETMSLTSYSVEILRG